MCVRVCPYDNLKNTARVCFLLGNNVKWRKISDKFARQDHTPGIQILFPVTLTFDPPSPRLTVVCTMYTEHKKTTMKSDSNMH